MNALADFELFSCLSEERVRALELRCMRRTYDENDLVFDYDEPSTDVCFVLSGRVRVLVRTANGKEFIFGELGGGDFFGELAAIDGIARSANVTALQRSQMILMPASVFVDIATHTPEIARAVLELLVTRVRRLSIKLAEQAYLSVKQRLYAEILRLSRPRAAASAERVITPPPVQQDLGNRIGARREVVSRELKALEKQGIVEKTRGALVIRDPDELNRRIAEEEV